MSAIATAEAPVLERVVSSPAAPDAIRRVFNFDVHEAERFAYRLASEAGGGAYGKLDELGYSTAEGRALVVELTRKQLESGCGLGYPEDPIEAVMTMTSEVLAEIGANHSRFPDKSTIEWGRIRNAFRRDPDSPFGAAATAFWRELNRTFRETFRAEEGDEAHGILPRAQKQTIERLAATAGSELLRRLAGADADERIQLELELLKKAGLVDRA